METPTLVPGKKTAINQVIEFINGNASILTRNVEEEERNGRLSQEVVSLLKEAGLFKLFLPQSLGGLELDPLTTAKIVEQVATYNTAAGWSLMVANTSVVMGGRLPERGIDEIFGNDPDSFIAGTVHPPMRAIRERNGYSISGRNALVSNVHEAQWVFSAAIVMEGQQPKITNGHPEILGVFLKVSDCEIIDTWHPLGMCATDSNDVEAKNVFVPDYMMFPFSPEYEPNRYYSGPLYRLPAAAANIACLLAPTTLAVARNAINELKTLADKKTPLGSMVPIKDRGVIQRKLGRAEALVQSGKIYLHEKLKNCWDRVLAGEKISLQEKAGLLLANTHVNQSCVEAVELMYTAAGSTGVYMRNKLAHYLTDSQVLRQHGFMNESRYETAGQVYLGLPPDLPIIEF
jgi:alkylation response protein AidB-like acyl-CoA dehydrogenase